MNESYEKRLHLDSQKVGRYERVEPPATIELLLTESLAKIPGDLSSLVRDGK